MEEDLVCFFFASKAFAFLELKLDFVVELLKLYQCEFTYAEKTENGGQNQQHTEHRAVSLNIGRSKTCFLRHSYMY